MAPRTFKTKILQEDGGAAGFVIVPFDVKPAFGKGARPPVVVTIGTHSWRSTPAVYGDKTYLPISKANREAAGVEPGDTVEITVALDTQPRVVKVPKDLAAALKNNATAAAAWKTLSFSHQREFAAAIEDARKPETRKARIAKTVATLAERAKSTKR
jgi:hypothetical protein